jgi:hypothetical protein
MYLADGGSWVDQHNWVPGAAIGVVAIVVSLIIAFRGRAKTTLDYATLSEVRVLTEKVSQLNSEIAVTVDGKTVSRPRFVTIRYKNTGRKEIRLEQFSDGVGLSATDGVVGVELAGVANKNMKMAQIGLMPDLRYAVESLNRGEWFDIQYLVDDKGQSGKLVPEYRVDGETRPPKDFAQLSGLTFRTVMWLLPFVLMVSLGGVIRLLKSWQHFDPWLAGVLAVVLVLSLGVGSAFLRTNYERRHPEVLHR